MLLILALLLIDNGFLIIPMHQVHEMAMVSAIQEAQKDNLRSFNDYMLKVLEVNMALYFSFLSFSKQLNIIELNNQ